MTSKPPAKGRLEIEIPQTEVCRGGLDTHIPLWVILDELNHDILERSYTHWKPERLWGLSPAFLAHLQQVIRDIRTKSKLKIAKRQWVLLKSFKILYTKYSPNRLLLLYYLTNLYISANIIMRIK